MYPRVKLVVHVPRESAEEMRRAIGEAGGGVIGAYTFCSVTTEGMGRFVPENGAKPYIGQNGIPSEIAEERIEVTCERSDAKHIIASIKRVHPYEEPTIDVYPLLDADDL